MCSLQNGFTYIELVMTVVIAAILSVGVTEFLGMSVSGYADRATREKMASTMVVASEKLARDLRRALPNSVRVGGDAGSADNCVEFIPVVSGSRYSSVPLATAAGTINSVSHGVASTLSAYIVIYPIDTTDLYTPTDASPSSITGAKASIPVGPNGVVITLGANHQFVEDSPEQRIYGVDDPIAYCQPAGSETLYRYTGYGFNSPAVLPPSGGVRDVLINELSSSDLVAFDYASATLTRNGVVSFELVAGIDAETMNLAQEAQIKNVP